MNFSHLLDSVDIGLVIFDHDLKVTLWNRWMAVHSGIANHEILGHTIFQFYPEIDQAQFQDVFWKAWRRGQYSFFSHKRHGYLLPFRNIGFSPEGFEHMHQNWTIGPLKDENDTIESVYLLIQDATQSLQTSLLQKKISSQKHTVKLKQDSLSHISHEIRTPLSSIIGLVEMAMEDCSDRNQLNYLKTINAEAQSLIALVNGVLDFSKIKAQKLEIEAINFDLRVLIEDISRAVGILSDRKGVDFISYIPPDVPTRLIGDPGKIRQILNNLLGNALKFTHSGEIFLQCDFIEKDEDDIELVFRVKDTGIGISPEKQNEIFESYSQADQSTTRIYGGTGLGTTIAKGLVELMGGKIGVESQEKKGSTFWFTLLLKKQPDATTQIKLQPMDLSMQKLLIVDSDASSRLMIKQHLKGFKCRIVEVADQDEALRLLHSALMQKDPFTMVLTDYDLPESDGFAFVRHINTHASLEKMPIVLFTSNASIGDGRRCRDLGIAGYLPKPIRRHELEEIVITVFSHLKSGENLDNPDLVTRHSLAENRRKEIQILLAEDYPTNQQIARQHLEKAGYQVDIVENGKIALEAFKRKHYDLILMDMSMPEMDGYEATAAIRQLEAKVEATIRNGVSDMAMTKRTPIIAATAHAVHGDQEKCLAAGTDDYIAKPLRKNELLAMVDKWVTPNLKFNTPTCDTSETILETHSDFPLDIKRAMAEFDNDFEFLDKVFCGFCDRLKQQIPIMRQALSNREADVIRNEAHAIKGGAANLAAFQLMTLASQLEEIGKSGKLTNGSEILGQIENEFHKLQVYFQESASRYVNQMNP